MVWSKRLHEWLTTAGVSPSIAEWTVETSEVIGVFFLAWLANFVAKRVIVSTVTKITERTNTRWDNMLVSRKVFHLLSHLAPALVIYALAPHVFESESLIGAAMKGAQIYMLVVGVLSLSAFLNAVHDIYRTFEVSSRIPIFAYLQVVKLLVMLAAVIVSVSVFIDKSPLLLLSGLGAATAILLLIFKDTILGLVAGIQLMAHDMVRMGDWIEMPKYGADGDVAEITLNVVKVRNFDMTVTTIPTYALITDSFKNWRGMKDSGGRRIKRAINVDIGSIHFLGDEEIDELTKIKKLRGYLHDRVSQIREYNEQYGDVEASSANGRRLTNIGAFREYCRAYLDENDSIHKDMTFLVRQLAPTPQGLPIEVYVFSNDQRWPVYEGIQADIFDHLFAVLPLFGLRAFQQPSGADLAGAAAALADKNLPPGLYVVK